MHFRAASKSTWNIWNHLKNSWESQHLHQQLAWKQYQTYLISSPRSCTCLPAKELRACCKPALQCCGGPATFATRRRQESTKKKSTQPQDPNFSQLAPAWSQYSCCVSWTSYMCINLCTCQLTYLKSNKHCASQHPHVPTIDASCSPATKTVAYPKIFSKKKFTSIIFTFFTLSNPKIFSNCTLHPWIISKIHYIFASQKLTPPPGVRISGTSKTKSPQILAYLFWVACCTKELGWVDKKKFNVRKFPVCQMICLR